MLPHDGRGPGVLEEGHRSFLAGAAIDGPSERRLPAAVFSTACRARDVASDTLCRAPPPRGRSLAAPESQVRFHRRLVKGNDLDTPERLPSTSAPYTPLARGITRSPPPFSRLCRRDPASGVRSPRTRTSMISSADEARPAPLGRGPNAARRLLQPNHPRARPPNRPNPNQRHRELPPGCARPVEPKPTDAVDQVTTLYGVQAGLRPVRTLRATPAEVSRARGVGLSPFRAPRSDCSRRGLCPNPIGSDTSCRELVTQAAGEAGCAGHPCWTGVGYESTRGETACAASP
jgi:hypothetical protein